MDNKEKPSDPRLAEVGSKQPRQHTYTDREISFIAVYVGRFISAAPQNRQKGEVQPRRSCRPVMAAFPERLSRGCSATSPRSRLLRCRQPIRVLDLESLLFFNTRPSALIMGYQTDTHSTLTVSPRDGRGVPNYGIVRNEPDLGNLYPDQHVADHFRFVLQLPASAVALWRGSGTAYRPNGTDWK